MDASPRGPAVTPTATPESGRPTSSPSPALSPAATASRATTPAATPTPRPSPAGTPSPAAAPGLGPEARLQRADGLVARGLWMEALAEARAVLEVQPRNSQATALAQRAEAELVIEECLRNARAALKEGDRERALEEVRRGFLVRKNDPRLLAMFREVMQQ